MFGALICHLPILGFSGLLPWFSGFFALWFRLVLILLIGGLRCCVDFVFVLTWLLPFLGAAQYGILVSLV